MNYKLFSRTALLFGDAGMERLQSLRVIIFGVGGVGSWCAESLVRTGIGHLTMVDCDVVCDSNVNRQLMATTKTVGRPKVEVMRERLLEINPNADIIARQEVFSAETAENFDLDAYDYVIDAIDSLKDKALLILRACESEACLFSSMGAARKLDPQRVKVTEFWKVEGDPLARTLRKRFKHDGVFPARKFQCVYSDERPSGEVGGTAAHVTAVFGLTLAAQVILHSMASPTNTPSAAEGEGSL